MANTHHTIDLINAIDRTRITCVAFDQSGDISDPAKAKMERQWEKAEQQALAAKPNTIAEAFAKLVWIMDEVDFMTVSPELRTAFDDLELQIQKA